MATMSHEAYSVGPPSAGPDNDGLLKYAIEKEAPASKNRSSFKDMGNLTRKWQERLKDLPLADDRAAQQLAQVSAVIIKLSGLAAQLELLAEGLISTANAAGLDAMELCRLIKEEVFSSADLQDTKSRGNSSYANKHIKGHPSQMYDLDEEVGAGAFGAVYKAQHSQTGQCHAVKFIPKSKVAASSLFAEMDIIKQLDHPHIMRLYNTFEDEHFLYLSSELCIGGPFFDHLRKAHHFEESVAGRLFRQIIGVTSYLHSRSICHRDIKPENFLVLRPGPVDHMHLKLIDFGTAMRFDLKDMVTKVCTPHYVAPEVLSKGAQPYTEKVDVWSCGVILFVMLSGQLPFHTDNQLELLKRVRKGRFEFEPSDVWIHISQHAHDLIRNILCVKVADRCNADQAFHQPWCEMLAEAESQGRPTISKDMVEQIHGFLTNNRLKRVALRIIARQIDDDAIEAQRSVWLSVDQDNSGTLTTEEMAKAILNLDATDMAKAGMVEIMRQLDPTGSGIVEYTEFLAACLTKTQYMQEEVCRAAFHRLDFDHDGIVSRKDLARLLSDKDGMRDAGLTGASLCELIDELENIMQDADGNNDGGVSFEEFMELMGDDGHVPSQSAVSRRSARPSHANYLKNMQETWATELVEYTSEVPDSEDEDSGHRRKSY